MLSLSLEPIAMSPIVPSPRAGREAFRMLADAARSYLGRLPADVDGEGSAPRTALITRVRGTGPGVSFGSLASGVWEGLAARWESPFEGCHNVSGAVLEAARILEEDRDDAFLLLRFEAGTADLPLHTHQASERFIYVLNGRGCFHVTADPLDATRPEYVRHVPVRSRDVLMFTRGIVHTFSTAGEPLELLSYHRPYIPLEDRNQYTVSAVPMLPRDFVDPSKSRISFDAGWSRLA